MEQKRQTYHHKDLRNALIETGIQLVSTEGVNAFSLRKDWLRRVVSAMPAPYSHFQNKEELLEAMQLFITDRFSKQLENLSVINNCIASSSFFFILKMAVRGSMADTTRRSHLSQRKAFTPSVLTS